MSDMMNQDINILVNLEVNDSASAVRSLEAQIKRVEKLLQDKGIQLNLGVSQSSMQKIEKTTDEIGKDAKKAGAKLGEGVRDSIEDLKKFQKLIDKIEKQLSKLGAKGSGTAQAQKLKSILNTYKDAANNGKAYDNVIGNQTRDTRSSILSEKARALAEQKRAQLTQDNVNQIKNSGRLVSKKVVYDPDGTRRAVEQKFRTSSGLLNTIQSNGNGVPHTIIRQNDIAKAQKEREKALESEYATRAKIASQVDKKRNTMTDKVERLYDNKIVPNDKLDKFAGKLFDAKDLSTLVQMEKELKKILELEKQINKESGQRQRNLDEEGKVRMAVEKAKQTATKKSEEDAKRTANLVQKSSESADKKISQLASSGKISAEKREELQNQLKEADNVEKLIALKRKLNEVEKQHRDTNVRNTGANSGTLDVSGGLDRLTNSNLERALRRGSDELKDMRVQTMNLNRVTGEWNATVRLADGQIRRIGGTIDRQTGQIRRNTDQINRNNTATRTMGELLRTAATRFPVWMAVTTAFYGITRGLRDMSEVIVKVDSQMTQLKRVMDSKTDFTGMLEASKNMAVELGQTITSVNDALIGFAKQGFNDTEILDLTKSAIVAANVSDLTVEESMDAMTSSIVQFKLEASDAMSIVDKWNEVDNNFAISSKDIAQGISKAGSTAKTFGVTVDELIGNITAIGEATRESGDRIGNGLKTIYSRLTSSDSLDALTKIGVAIQDQNGDVLNATQLLENLSGKWEGLSAAQQQNTGVTVAGRYQLSRFLALMNNWKTSVNATTTALQSSGSAMRENDKFQQSLQARINRLKATWQDFSLTVGDAVLTDSMISGMKILMSLLSGIGTVIGKVGLLPPILFAIGMAMNGLIKRMLTFIATNWAASTSTNIFQKSLNALGLSIKGVGLGLKSLLASTGVGLAFLAIGFVIEKLISAHARLKSAQEELKTINYEQVKSLSDLRNSLLDTSKTYEELRNKKNKTKEDETELIRIQEQLAEQYGVSATGITANGKLYSDNILLINERVEALNKEIKAEKELNETKLKATDSDVVANIQNGIKDRNDQFDRIKLLEAEQKLVEDRVKQGGKLTSLDLTQAKKSGWAPVDIEFNPLDSSKVGSDSVIKNSVEAMLKSYATEIAKAKGKISKINGEFQKDLDIRASVFSGFSESKMKEIDSKIAEKANRISDAQRNLITKVSKAMSFEDANPDQIKDQLSEFVDAVSNSPMKKLTEGYQKSLDDFNKIPSDEAKKKVEEFAKNIGLTIDSLVGNLKVGSDETKKEFTEITNTFKNGFKPNLTNRKLDFRVDLEALAESAKEVKNQLTPLDEALQAIEKSESLTGQEAMDLITQYDELAGKVYKTADGWQVEKGAVEELRKTKVDAFNDIVDKETKTTKLMQDELSKRLLVYGKEIATISTIEEGRNAYDKLGAFSKDASKERGNLLMDDNINSGDIERDSNLLAEWIKNLERASNLKDIVADKGFGAKAEKASKDAKDIKEAVIDEFANAIQELDEKIKESELRMANYTSTSKEYRDEIALQVEALKEKQKLSHIEADRLRSSNSGLKNQLSAMGSFNSLSDDNKEKYNDLSQEIDKNNSSIRQLSSSWLDFEATIQSKAFDKITSTLDEMNKGIDDLDDKLNRSKAIQGTLDDGSQEFRNQIKEQIGLLKEKQIQSHIIAEQIRKELSDGGLNDNDRDKLEKRLKGLSDSWWDYEGEVTSANKALRQQADDIADKTIELYKDMYRKQKDLALEAIDEQEKELEKAHDARVKQIEKETDVFEKSIQSQIDGIDRLANERTYNQDLDQKQKDREKLQKQFDRLSLSSDNADKLRAKQLAEEIAKSDLEIENTKLGHSDETRKDALQKQLDEYKTKQDLAKETATYEVEIDGKKYVDQYENLKDFIDKEKLATTKKYDGMIEDEKKFQKIRQQIIEGTFSLGEQEFAGFKKYLEENAIALGNTIQTSLLDRIKSLREELKMVRSEASVIEEMQNNSNAWFGADKNTQQQLSDANNELGSQIGASKDNNGDWIGSGGKPLFEANGFYKPANDEEKQRIAQMKTNSSAWNSTSDGTRKKQLEDANSVMGGMLGAINKGGTWFKNNLPLYHEGGITGKTSSNKLTDIVNKMFNVGADEALIKSLVGEVNIPENNIAKNFKPTMSRFASAVSAGSSSGDTNYNLNINIEKVEKGSEDKVISTLIKGVKKLGGKT